MWKSNKLRQSPTIFRYRDCRLSVIVLITLCLVMGASSFGASSAGASISKHKAVVKLTEAELAMFNSLNTFDEQAAKLKNSKTPDNYAAVTRALGSAFQKFQGELLNQSWPSVAKSDVRMTYTDTSPLIADMIDARAITNNATASAWESRSDSDLTAWVSELNIVNHDLGLPTFTSMSIVLSCQADGATVRVAIEAFEAENPGMVPTKALLTGHADGGPYIENWPHNAPHYVYSMTHAGKLLISAPSVAKPIVYRGPSDCNAAF